MSRQQFSIKCIPKGDEVSLSIQFFSNFSGWQISYPIIDEKWLSFVYIQLKYFQLT